MLKQSPSRNQRSKGLKVKHALQVCVLLAICIWLLYQVKHSHHKKLALEESSGQNRQGHGILKLGRKDLNPQVEGELGAEDEESKGDEIEDEGRGGGDDEIDGLDQDKAEEDDTELLEDLIDEDDKEREDGTEGRESEQNEDPMDKIIGWNSKKAREEHNKADGAASDVVQNTHIVSTENENVALRAMMEEEQHVKNVAKNELEIESKTYSIGEINQEDKIHSRNSFSSEENVGEFDINILDDRSHFNSSLKAEFNEQEVNSNSVTADVNSDTAKTELGDSYIESKSAVQEEIVKLDAAAGTEDNSASISTTEMAGAGHSRDSNANSMAEELEEVSESSTRNEIAENTRNEPIDSSFYQDNKEDHNALLALLETNLPSILLMKG
ncbi:uncharacterized protein LOC132277984 [Cornus florida]|uniref:uncharacterized protein LOC132277984 n=1 Tax=Cornus florida TaxID=4283 RepID=UPI0028967528|nr:uncharacterized protein LOC132277984 [Cornus florida]